MAQNRTTRPLGWPCGSKWTDWPGSRRHPRNGPLGANLTHTSTRPARALRSAGVPSRSDPSWFVSGRARPPRRDPARPSSPVQALSEVPPTVFAECVDHRTVACRVGDLQLLVRQRKTEHPFFLAVKIAPWTGIGHRLLADLAETCVVAHFGTAMPLRAASKIIV